MEHASPPNGGCPRSWEHYEALRAIAARVHRPFWPVMELDELFHRVLLKWLRYPNFPAKGSPLTDDHRKLFWVSCRRVLVDELRHRAAERKALVELARLRASCPQTGSAGEVDMRDFVRHLLEKLPPRERRIMQLRYQKGLRFAGIAECLGLAEAHVRQAHHRALKQLREVIQELG